MSRKPSAVADLVAQGGIGTLWFFAFISAKNLPWALYVLLIVSYFIAQSHRYARLQHLRWVAAGLTILVVAALFSPADVCVRRGGQFALSLKPVEVVHGAYGRVRKREALDEQRDRDFVVYSVKSGFNQVRMALVVTLP